MAFKRVAFAVLVLVTLSVFTLSLAAPVPRRTSPVRRGSNPKRGIAFSSSDSPTSDLNQLANTAISWEYNWAVEPPANLPEGIEHVPMQWGSGDIESFQASVLAMGATHILGFNEPDQSGQSNIDPNTAASLWQQYINPLSSSGIKLGAPAVSAAPGGLPWLQSFISACSGCQIDFIPIHWYGQGSQYFIQYLATVNAAFPNYSIWVTEYADTTTGDAGAVQTSLTDSISQMDTLSYVERYSWFDFSRSTPGMETNLLDGNGNLNALGEAYIQ